MQISPLLKRSIHKWLNREGLTPKEASALEEEKGWLRHLEQAERLSLPEAMTTEEAWQAFLSLRENKSQQPRLVVMPKPIFAPRIWIAAAASIAILAALAWWSLPQWIVLQAPYGASVSAILPDSSRVNINAGSTLQYDRKGWIHQRTLTLEGEAFFEVKQGSQFIVQTQLGEIKVLGTAFNARIRNQILEVGCSQGLVQVAAKNGAIVTLQPGWAVQATENGLSDPYSHPVERTAPWTRGEFFFEKTPLNFVFLELERQFDVKVSGGGNGKRLYTGFFSNQNLDQALSSICNPMGLSYRIELPNKVEIME